MAHTELNLLLSTAIGKRRKLPTALKVLEWHARSITERAGSDHVAMYLQFSGMLWRTITVVQRQCARESHLTSISFIIFKNRKLPLRDDPARLR